VAADHLLPQYHDWIGVVALFPPYKYQGREMKKGTEKKKKKTEAETERGEDERKKSERK